MGDFRRLDTAHVEALAARTAFDGIPPLTNEVNSTIANARKQLVIVAE